jgi:hypothetical protein
MGDEGFDQISAGFFESFGTAEVCGVGLHECGIEIELANQKAELVAQSRLAVTRTISVPGNRRGLLGIRRWRRRRKGSKLFDRAQADTISLAEGAIDSACLSHTHLCTADERRDVRGIGIAVSHKPARARRLVDSRLEDPAAPGGITKTLFNDRFDSKAAAVFCYAQEACMSDIPPAIKEAEFSSCHIQQVRSGHYFESCLG